MRATDQCLMLGWATSGASCNLPPERRLQAAATGPTPLPRKRGAPIPRQAELRAQCQNVRPMTSATREMRAVRLQSRWLRAERPGQKKKPGLASRLRVWNGLIVIQRRTRKNTALALEFVCGHGLPRWVEPGKAGWLQ